MRNRVWALEKLRARFQLSWHRSLSLSSMIDYVLSTLASISPFISLIRFKKAFDRAKLSGREAVNFTFYDVMEPLFGRDARVEREVSIAGSYGYSQQMSQAVSLLQFGMSSMPSDASTSNSVPSVKKEKEETAAVSKVESPVAVKKEKADGLVAGDKNITIEEDRDEIASKSSSDGGGGRSAKKQKKHEQHDSWTAGLRLIADSMQACKSYKIQDCQ